MEYGLFTQEEANRVALEFGFEEFDRLNESVITALYAVESPQRKERLMATLDEIAILETKITELLQKGFIEQVDTVRLGYIRGANRLMNEASRKLHWAARIANLEVKYDRFKENSGRSHSVLAYY